MLVLTGSRFRMAVVGLLIGAALGCGNAEPYTPAVSGTGGGPGTGGSASGTGGSSMGSGGSVGTGGSATGSGGSTGTGGRVGTGGMTGSGGVTGTGGAVIVAPTGTVLLLEDFDGSNKGPYKWYPADTIGTWAVAMDGASMAMQEQTVVGSLSLNVGGNVAWTDVIVEAKVNFKTFTSTSAIVYLATRFIDTKNYYFLEFHADGSMKIRRKIAGSSTDLLQYKSNIPVVMGTVYTIAFGIKGSTVTAYLNGTAVMSFPDTPNLPAGGIALGTQQVAASFDDVKVTAP